jgi:hypothetical protein
MNVFPAVEVKSFEKCNPGELIRFLNDEGNSSFGVIVTQTNEWQEVERLVCEFRDGEVRLSDYTLGEHVISLGSEWEIVLSDFDVRTRTKGQLKPGIVLLKDSRPYWFIGAGDPSTGGLRAVSLKEARVGNLAMVGQVAYSWSLRLPDYSDKHPSPTDLITFSAKPTT